MTIPQGIHLRIAITALLAASVQLPAQTPDDSLRQALAAHQAGQIQKAIEGYETYLKSRPANPMVVSNLGAAYARVGRYEDAIAQYRAALKSQPENIPVQLNMALAYYKSGDLDGAAPVFEKVHKAMPTELQPALLLGDCWLAMGRNKDVVALLTPFSGGKPENPAVLYALCTAMVRDNQTERGQLLIEKLIRSRGESAEVHLLMATTRLNSGDSAGALAEMEQAVKLNPELPDVHSFHGLALLRTGDQKGAAEAFRKALERNPNDFAANLQLGSLSRMDQNNADAGKYLHKALLVRPGDPGVRYQLASLDFAEGKVEEARASLEAMIRETPNFLEAHVTLATVYYRLRRKEDGDKERAIIRQLNAEAQEKQPGVRPVAGDKKP